jgi:phage tail-like protein
VPATAHDPNEPAIALRFWVKIDDIKINRITGCDGLSAEYELDEYREGGQAGFVHRLPVRLKHTNVRLIRPIDSDSRLIANWFSETQKRPCRRDATIMAYDGDGAEVASWVLSGAWVVKYTGPTFSSTSVLAATETIEIAHNGFKLKGSS